MCCCLESDQVVWVACWMSRGMGVCVCEVLSGHAECTDGTGDISCNYWWITRGTQQHSLHLSQGRPCWINGCHENTFRPWKLALCFFSEAYFKRNPEPFSLSLLIYESAENSSPYTSQFPLMTGAGGYRYNLHDSQAWFLEWTNHWSVFTNNLCCQGTSIVQLLWYQNWPMLPWKQH